MERSLKDLVILITGFLTVTMGFLATLNIEYEWLTNESITAFGSVILAFFMLIGGFYAVYKNTYYITKKARLQNDNLKRSGLK